MDPTRHEPSFPQLPADPNVPQLASDAPSTPGRAAGRRTTKPAERLAEFYRRLTAAVPFRSADAAMKQISEILEHVEDEFSGISKRTTPPGIGDRDGRMYPPLDDHLHRHDDGGLTAFTRGHRIEIDAAGRVEIFDRRTATREFPDE